MNELCQEAETTNRLLDRVPSNKLDWRPHSKSMSLGQLALHVASIPGDLTRLAQLDQFDAANANFEPAMPGLSGQQLSPLPQSPNEQPAVRVP